MPSTCTLYIDAGYLLGSAATRVTGTSLRSGIHVDDARLVRSLVEAAETRSGCRCCKCTGMTGRLSAAAYRRYLPLT